MAMQFLADRRHDETTRGVLDQPRAQRRCQREDSPTDDGFRQVDHPGRGGGASVFDRLGEVVDSNEAWPVLSRRRLPILTTGMPRLGE